MMFANSIYLWGFLGLAVPIAIHLWSKKEGRIIKVGSIKLLREADPKQTSNLKINEYWLLLLRTLIISLLVLILAEPQVKKEVEPLPVMYLVEASLLSYDGIHSILDSIEPGPSLRLLKEGFPELDKDEWEISDSSTPDYWELARGMEKLPADSIVVFTNAFLSGIKGKRPEVNKNINWILLDPGSSEEALVEAWEREDEVQLISVVSDHQRLTYKKEIVPIKSSRIQVSRNRDSLRLQSNTNSEWLPLRSEEAISVLIFYDESLENERKFIESSFGAIGKYLERPLEVVAVKEQDSLEDRELQLLVWLSQEPPVETAAPLLLYRPDSLANALIEAGPSRNTFQLTESLNVENTVEEHLPERLLQLLDLHPGLEKKLEPHDRRILERKGLLPVTYETESINNKYSEVLDFNHWLWFLLLAVLLVERILARYRNQ